MKLRNKRGNTCHAQYYTGTGAEKTEKTLSVGPETVELSQVHGEYMLNLFGSRELEVVGGGRQDETEPSEPTSETVSEPPPPGTNVNFVPGLDSSKTKEEVPDLAALAAKLPGGSYMCGKCRAPHRETSGKGVSHLKYKV